MVDEADGANELSSGDRVPKNTARANHLQGDRQPRDESYCGRRRRVYLWGEPMSSSRRISAEMMIMIRYFKSDSRFETNSVYRSCLKDVSVIFYLLYRH